MPELHLPWLELTILTPLLGSILVGVLRDGVLARKICLTLCTLTLVFATGEWLDFGTLHTFQAHDHWDVLQPVLGADILVVDELSAPLLPLAALLYLMTVLSTLRTKQNRFSFGWTLASEAILLSTFCCRDAWAIILLLILAAIPPWIELRTRGRCTRVYSLHMSLFAGLLIIGQGLISTGLLGEASVSIAGALLTAAALLRSGIIPLHCWIRDLLEKASFGTALLFLTPMTGAYAVMRLVLPIAPDWALQSIAMVSLLTSVYAAGMAMVQDEARKFFCYLFLSHSSLVLVGLELVTPIGLTGALCVWLSVGLSLAGFALTLRCIESRIGQISLQRFHGLYEQTPTLAALYLLTGLASIGFPGTASFIGTELLIEGAVGVFPLIGTAVVIATALNGIAIMNVFFRIFTGTRFVASISLRARPSEYIAVLVLIAILVGGGLFPQWGVASRYHAAMALIGLRTSQQAEFSKPTEIFSNQPPHDPVILTESQRSQNELDRPE